MKLPRTRIVPCLLFVARRKLRAYRGNSTSRPEKMRVLAAKHRRELLG